MRQKSNSRQHSRLHHIACRENRGKIRRGSIVDRPFHSHGRAWATGAMGLSVSDMAAAPPLMGSINLRPGRTTSRWLGGSSRPHPPQVGAVGTVVTGYPCATARPSAGWRGHTAIWGGQKWRGVRGHHLSGTSRKGLRITAASTSSLFLRIKKRDFL